MCPSHVDKGYPWIDEAPSHEVCPDLGNFCHKLNRAYRRGGYPADLR
jgi:hypothetical protein